MIEEPQELVPETPIQFYCLLCKMDTYSKEDFISHIQQQHSNTNSLKVYYSNGSLTLSLSKRQQPLASIATIPTQSIRVRAKSKTQTKNAKHKQLNQGQSSQENIVKRPTSRSQLEPSQPAKIKKMKEFNPLKNLIKLVQTHCAQLSINKSQYEKTALGIAILRYYQSWKVQDDANKETFLMLKNGIVTLHLVLTCQHIQVQVRKLDQLSSANHAQFFNYFILNFIPNLHLEHKVMEWMHNNQLSLTHQEILKETIRFLRFCESNLQSLQVYTNPWEQYKNLIQQE